jgi:hypothetical protein
MLHRSTSRAKLSPCERMVREWLLFNATKAIFQLYYDENKLHFDDDLFLLVQQAELDFYSVSLVKQQYTGRHVAPLRHIVLIPSQPVIAHTPYWCVLSREATNTNFNVFGLTRSGLEHMIYHTRCEHANHYTTDVMSWIQFWIFLLNH